MSLDRRRVRGIIFKTHAWLGLQFCIVLFVIFLTGLLLMFSPEINSTNKSELWIAPPNAEAQTASVGQIYDSVRSAVPGAQIHVMVSPPRPWFGARVYGHSDRGNFVAHVHPVTAEILAFDGGSFLRKVVRRLHDSLLLPVSFANTLVNALSLVVLTLVATGLITYRRFWKGYVRKPEGEKGTRKRHGELHRLVAVWVAPFLIVSALGSTFFLSKELGLKPELPRAEAPVPRDVRIPEEFNGDALDRLARSCFDALPTLEIDVADLSAGPERPMRFVGHDTEVGPIFGSATCHVDPSTGNLLGILRSADGNLAAKLDTLALKMHYGTWAGWTSIVLWVIGGALSLILAFTGARVYASRIVSAGDARSTPRFRRSTVPVVIKGLGMGKWVYLLIPVGALITILL